MAALGKIVALAIIAVLNLSSHDKEKQRTLKVMWSCLQKSSHVETLPLPRPGRKMVKILIQEIIMVLLRSRPRRSIDGMPLASSGQIMGPVGVISTLEKSHAGLDEKEPIQGSEISGGTTT